MHLLPKLCLACQLPPLSRAAVCPVPLRRCPRPQSKLFALTHAGLAFRYARWQHAAALQTALLAAAAAQTSYQDVCGRPDLASPARGRPLVQHLAAMLTNAHLLPLRPTPGAGGGQGGTEAQPGGPHLLVLPAQLDACPLLLTWLQASCGGLPALRG